MYVGKLEKFSNFLKDERIVFLGSKDEYSSWSPSESELMYMYMIIDNYRPISILPSISKILKKLVYRQLMAHLDRNGMQSHFQYGLLRISSYSLYWCHQKTNWKWKFDRLWIYWFFWNGSLITFLVDHSLFSIKLCYQKPNQYLLVYLRGLFWSLSYS